MPEATRRTPFTRWFEGLGIGDVRLAGDTNASLGEMSRGNLRGGEGSAVHVRRGGRIARLSKAVRFTRVLPTVLLMGSLAGTAVAAEAEPAPEIDPLHRVVIHLSSGDEQAQRGALSNIKNLYHELGRDHLTVELVAHGPGLRVLVKKDTAFGEDLAKLKEAYGVEYTACSNTMKALGLTRQDLIEQVDRTEPAMVRIMELQEQGWVYIKP